MHPLLFVVGGVPIYAYGTLLLTGIVAAAALFNVLAQREGLPRGGFLAFLVLYVGGVVGSRVLYVVANHDEFDTVASMFGMRRGGLIGYGALLGGGVAIYLLVRRARVRFLAVADLAAPSLAVLTMVARLGCYAFGCDFGVPLSQGAPSWLRALGTFPHWPRGTLEHGDGAPAWVQHVKERGLSVTAAASLPVHPTQLYEVVLGGVFVGAYFLARPRQRFRGQIFLQLVLAYGTCRFALDPLRDDIERGAVGPAVPEHLLVAAGLAALAGGFAAWVAPAIEDFTVRRAVQAAAFVPAVLAFAALRPATSADTSAVALSTNQFMALATGLAAAYGFARARTAALADSAGAMSITIAETAPPADDPDEEPRPARKKKKKRRHTA